MIKNLMLLGLVFLLGIAGCSLLDSGLTVGDVAEGDLDDGVDIEQLIPDAENVLLPLGILVENNWPALEYSLKSGDGISVFVEADRHFDPVIVLIDSDGNILAVGDDWDDELDAFVSIDNVPEGTKIVVFNLNGDDGVFNVQIEESEDYDWQLQVNEGFDSFILDAKENDEWDDALQDFEELYIDSWETCRVFPLSLRSEKWIKITVESSEDCMMTLLKVESDELVFVGFDDDTYEMNPQYSGMLNSGDYLVLVNTYEGSIDANFFIEVTELDPDDMTIDIINADEMDIWFSGYFNEGAFVESYWPNVNEFDVNIVSTESAIVYEFEIEDAGEYIFDVDCLDDTKLAIIDSNNNLIDYNDDGPEGYNPELVLELSPGYYSAIVLPYDGFSLEMVEFRYMISAPIVREIGYAPYDETFQMHSTMFYSLVFDPGTTYEIFAESDDIDLTLSVIDGAGEVYYSDDDGGDFNPFLEIEATENNAGSWDIDLGAYSDGSINGEVHFVASPLGSSNRLTDSSAQIK